MVPCFTLLGLTPSGLFMGLCSTIIYTSELILWFHYLCSQCYAAQHSYVPLLSIRRDSPSKSSPTFSVRPCSSVGRVTEDLIRRSWVRFPPRSKDFFFASCGSLFPFTRANAQWVIHGLCSTIIYTSELILWFHYLCSQCYAAQHSYVPLLSIRRDSPSKSSPTFSVRPCSSVGRVTEDLIRRSWVRFPPRSKDFFFASCGSLFPFTRANAQWVIHGFM